MDRSSAPRVSTRSRLVDSLEVKKTPPRYLNISYNSQTTATPRHALQSGASPHSGAAVPSPCQNHSPTSYRCGVGGTNTHTLTANATQQLTEKVGPDGRMLHGIANQAAVVLR